MRNNGLVEKLRAATCADAAAAMITVSNDALKRARDE
jgi:hypothetical protein